jgi:hypothetical protein
MAQYSSGGAGSGGADGVTEAAGAAEDEVLYNLYSVVHHAGRRTLRQLRPRRHQFADAPRRG